MGDDGTHNPKGLLGGALVSLHAVVRSGAFRCQTAVRLINVAFTRSIY